MAEHFQASGRIAFRFRDPRVWLVPVLALAAMGPLAWDDLDRALFVLLNQSSDLGSDRFWAMVTVLGDTLVALTLFVPFVGRRPDIIWAVLLTALLATLWVHGLKHLVNAPRPPAVLAGHALHVIGPAHRSGSFPSGHATTAFAAAGVFALYFHGRARPAIFALVALVVALSRSVVGVHWPLDLAAGAFGGWLAAVLGIGLSRRWPVGLSAWAQWPLGLILAGGAAVLLAGYPTGYGVEGFERAVAAACLLLLAGPFIFKRVRGRARVNETDAPVQDTDRGVLP